MVGAALILPGPKLDGESICHLISRYQVSSTAAVPTVCAGLLAHCQQKGIRLSSLQTICIGGAACPPSMIDEFQEKHGVTVRHLWGMTETSPIGTVGALKAAVAARPEAEKRKILRKQGRPHVLLAMRVVDSSGAPLPHDGTSSGELQVRGPHVLRAYFKNEEKRAVDEEGWFSTGDVATIDPLGHMQITDRSKDVIKSGGEWISSIEVENAAAACPGVQEAAVVGIAHPKWTERPLLIVVRTPGHSVTKEDILESLKGKIAKWWIPEECIFVEEIPHTAAGKISKVTLRKQLKELRQREEQHSKL